MKEEVSAPEALLIFVFWAAGYAALGVFHPSFSALLVGPPTLFVVHPLLVLAHELGHAAAAVHVTRRPATVQCGDPPYSWRCSIGRVRVEYALRGYVAHCVFDRSVPISGGGRTTSSSACSTCPTAWRGASCSTVASGHRRVTPTAPISTPS